MVELGDLALGEADRVGHGVSVQAGGGGGSVPPGMSPWVSPPGPGGVRITPPSLLPASAPRGSPVADLLRDLDRRDRDWASARRNRSRRDGRGGAAAGSKISAICGLVEGLLVEQLEHQRVEDVAVLLEEVVGLLVRGGEELLDLLVDDRGDLFGVVALVAHVAAQERLGVAVAELDRAEPVTHAVLRDHRAGEVGRLLDVVAGTAGDVVEDQRLGRHAAEHVGQLVEHLAARLAVLVLVGQHHRVAQRATARQDRHLVHRVGAGQRRGDEGVAALVVGRDQLLLLAHQAGAPLRAGDHPVDGLVEAVRR